MPADSRLHAAAGRVAPLRRAALALLLAAFALASAGCEIFGLAAMMVPQTKDAVYVIPDRPTVILVDDPKNLLRDPQLPLVVAASAADVLKTNDVIAEIVDVRKVTALAAELGDKYAKTSVYEIGRRLGAKQLIHVNVFAASESPEPGVLRPAMQVGVKVFDVDAKQRLFPPGAKATGVPETGGADGFYMHTVSLRHRVTDANPARVIAIARQKLAEEAGSSIARLFFKHDPALFDDIRQ